ncbi:MAG: response regulator transcription factor [Proteobacteria bacterium]|nr:response regulator transcription factor [Pseudomonadota bacterium]MBU1139621.1 response regulator transcription factor [Pseudomonadota bacterium]MBU1419068.1 response regulator transcription factor [Pseudomonadota bacterium]MBU1456270.1 response regulator transcription factor [Pseudomonadota bacterium]
MRILVVDDEPVLLVQLQDILESLHYTVDVVTDGEAALERLFDDMYDLILLDIMLPTVDGFAVLRQIRGRNINTPVLMLTAKGDVEDKIKGLDLGADDYLAKPFSISELLARIRALLRRSGSHGSPILSAGDLSVNTASREAFKGQLLLDLTPKEFSILEFLLYNKNRTVSRFNMAEHVWGDEFDPFTMSNSIDVHIKNLRRKIGDPAAALINTVRGVGYMIKDNE